MPAKENAVATEISTELAKKIKEETGQNVYLCYQCVKCTSGCPMAEHFDLEPNQVMRMVQFGDESVLESKTIWTCASCLTCSTLWRAGCDVRRVDGWDDPGASLALRPSHSGPQAGLDSDEH